MPTHEVVSRVIIGLGPIAKILQVSVPQIYVYMREGMPGKKIGGHWHFHSVAVDNWFLVECSETADKCEVEKEVLNSVGK
jgi:hypothetical protein